NDQICDCSLGVFADTDAVKSVSVLEGDSVTINTGLTERIYDDLILWRFGTENTLIAEMIVMADSMTEYNDDLDGRFRDKLKLDETGSLTITNITTEHTGLYQLQTNSVSKNFSLTVYARLPVPDIFIRDYSSSLSSSSSYYYYYYYYYYSLLCSVMNVSDVTLSWYKGNSLLSSISVSDLSISLSLPLEVEYQDKNTYSCVINNPISHQTTHLDINKLCHTCSDYDFCCDSAEVVIRLALSALVGVATVAVLVYDIRPRRSRHHSTDLE
ncbi:uncharacterized protein LOC127161223, partial [Labeo rohita]|uniref:uncharacterized protein LOC127161223 n=1 Tax=Labeo rohita TaxID=84645 RepID=UPI0021E1F633